MGWTHSWQRPTELSADKFAAAVSDFRILLEHATVPLAGFDGTGFPRLSDDSITFNGKGAAGVEPFDVRQVQFDRRGRNRFWSSCKTEQAPYDLYVQAALIVLRHHLGDTFVVQSDGSDSDWDAARRLCTGRLGYGEDFRLDTGS